MKDSTFTPEESLLLISKTIEATKNRFKENGHIFIFWGTLILIVIGSQLTLSLLELYKYTMYPSFLYPIGGVYMIYIWINEKKKNQPKTHLGNMLENLGWIFGLNFLVLGFLCSDKLGSALAPVFIILFGLFIIVCGLTIKFKPLTIGGILVNLLGLGSLFIERDYHGFSMMLMAIIGFIIPGILLNIARSKNHV